MKTKADLFKHFLLASILIAGLGCGCKSMGNKEPGENYSLIMLYLEQNNDGTK